MAEAKLERAHFQRVDETDDADFYRLARLVTHIDPPACAALAAYYATTLPAGGDILDLMSSWVSHLPDDVTYGSVTGLGMNAEELDANPRLDRRLVHDLNQDPVLPFADGEFDGCLIAVSIQYLVQPIAVFAEIARVSRPGAPCIVSFSNRMFPTKAVAVWRALGDSDHARLVGKFFVDSGGFDPPDLAELSPDPGQSDPLFAVIARRSGGTPAP